MTYSLHFPLCIFFLPGSLSEMKWTEIKFCDSDGLWINWRSAVSIASKISVRTFNKYDASLSDLGRWACSEERLGNNLGFVHVMRAFLPVHQAKEKYEDRTLGSLKTDRHVDRQGFQRNRRH